MSVPHAGRRYPPLLHSALFATAARAAAVLFVFAALPWLPASPRAQGGPGDPFGLVAQTAGPVVTLAWQAPAVRRGATADLKHVP